MTDPAGESGRRQSTGFVRRGFEAVRHQLDAYLLGDPTYSAQLAVYWKDELVIDLVGGPELDADSITGVFSVSKGVAAVAMATLIASGQLDLDEHVVHYWPEFAPHGKDAITVRQLLSHQAGLLNVDGGLLLDEITESDRGAARLAAQRPVWRPGSAFGYHAVTIGLLMEELVRRTAGASLQALYERVVRAPRDIDFYLGLPESQEPRFRAVGPVAPTPRQAAERAELPMSPDGLTAFTFARGGAATPGDDGLTPNNRAVRAAGPTATGGIGSARGLAAVYAAALGNLGDPFVDRDTLEAMSQQQVWGHDRVLNLTNCFGIVFLKPQPRMEFGSYRAFGHDGAGGALAYADPLHDLAFGFIPLPMQYPGGADPKAVQLSQLVREAVTAGE